MKTRYAPPILVVIVVISLGAFWGKTAADSPKEPDAHEELMHTALSGAYTMIGGHPSRGPLYRGKCSIEARDGKLFMNRDIDGKSETSELTYHQEKPEGHYTWNVHYPKAKLRISYVESSYHDNHKLLVGEATQYNAAGESEFFGLETAYPAIYISHDKEETEQDGTGQPATRPESKSEGSDKPQPESEGCSR